MSVNMDDEMAQRESMLHTDQQIETIRSVLKTGSIVSRWYCENCQTGHEEREP